MLAPSHGFERLHQLKSCTRPHALPCNASFERLKAGGGGGVRRRCALVRHNNFVGCRAVPMECYDERVGPATTRWQNWALCIANASCYASRYPELRESHCSGGDCVGQSLLNLTEHFYSRGRYEGRQFSCEDVVEPTSPTIQIDGPPFAPSRTCEQFYLTGANSSTVLAEVQRRWQAARRLAGLEPLTAAQLIESSFFMRRFFRFPYGTAQATRCGTLPSFTYARISKAASNFFTGTIKRLCGETRKSKRAAAGRSTRVYPASQGPGPAPLVFTFVRDPLSHFISGYGEATWRTFTACCSGHDNVCTDDRKSAHALYRRGRNATVVRASAAAALGPPCATKQQQRETALAREFVVALLDANASLIQSRRHALDGIFHAFLQAGALQRFDLRAKCTAMHRTTTKCAATHFVGHVETVQTDWDRLAKGLGLPAFQDVRKEDVGQHASTSGDVLGRRGALAAVLEAEPLLKRGILELLALDYECFGYEMPTVSKG